MGLLNGSNGSLPIEWGVAHMAQPGQHESGDGFVVEAMPPRLLLSVVDGLGHGAKAAAATNSAVEAIKGSAQQDVVSIVQRCHQALVGTRGAVMSLGVMDAESRKLTWMSVGNVTGLLVRGDTTVTPARQHLLLRGGVVGYRLPPLRPFTETIHPGDTLIFATDGIRSSFLDDLPSRGPAQQMADYILLRHARKTDDALVAVARYLPSSTH